MKTLSEAYKQQLHNAIVDTVDFKELHNSTVLITGITGLIGGFLVDMLLYANENEDANITIFGLARNKEKLQDRFAYTNSEKLKFIIQDVCNPIENIKPDYIIHAAGDGYPEAFRERPIETMRPAILGTINTLELAKQARVKAYLYISSGEVYGNSQKVNKPFKENDNYNATPMYFRSCYPVGKQAAETLCASYHWEHGVDVRVARLSHTYGAITATTDNRATTQFIKAAAAGEDIVLHSQGKQVRSFTYIADAASAILTILIKGSVCQSYNVSNDASIASVAEFAKAVAALKKVGCQFEIANENQLKEHTPITYAVLDNENLKSLGWKGRYNLEDGLKAAFEI